MVRILLVDDDELVRMTTQRILERSGFAVTVCESPEVARQHYSEQVDIVLADVRMPGETGVELVRSLGAQRVILTSGMDQPPADFDTLPTTARYIAKPFAIPELTAMINELMESPESP